jgi:hypothetical protein
MTAMKKAKEPNPGTAIVKREERGKAALQPVARACTTIVDGGTGPDIAYPHDRQLQEFVSAGIKRNGRKVFRIELQGQYFYDLLKVLDDLALKTESILDLREAVRLSDRIAEQLRAQGFYG